MAQNRKRYEVLRNRELYGWRIPVVCTVFQNRKRYEVLRNLKRLINKDKVTVVVFQNRKRYEVLRNINAAINDVCNMINGFKTASGMKSCAIYHCKRGDHQKV